MPRCPPEGCAVSARLKVSCARSLRSRSNKGSATVWCAHASKRFCARSLRGNTFSGYKFENKRPPAQSPKMMIVRERPHSPNKSPLLTIFVRRPRASPYGMPRTSRLARQPSLPRTMLRAQEPEFHQGQGGGCRRGTRPGGEADGRKVACGRKGERIRAEKIGFLGRKICK